MKLPQTSIAQRRRNQRSADSLVRASRTACKKHADKAVRAPAKSSRNATLSGDRMASLTERAAAAGILACRRAGLPSPAERTARPPAGVSKHRSGARQSAANWRFRGGECGALPRRRYARKVLEAEKCRWEYRFSIPPPFIPLPCSVPSPLRSADAIQIKPVILTTT